MKIKSDVFFSIIIPTKKPNLKFFKECVLSVYNQKFENFELLIVANGCDEQDINAIKKKIIFFPNAFVYVNNEIGLSKARNFGLKYAKGKYVIFLDDDDAISDDFLEIAYLLISSYDCDLLTFKDTSDIFELNKKSGLSHSILEGQEIANLFLKNNIINKKCEIRSVWSKVFKKSIIDDNNLEFVHNLPAEDIEFVLRYSFHSKKMIVVDKYGYFYRYRPESISHRCDATIIERFDLLHETLDHDLTLYGHNLHYLYFHITNYSIFNVSISYLFHKDNKLSLFKEIKILRKICKNKYYEDAIKTIKVKEMFTRKKKIVLFFLKIHFYLMVSILLSLRYKR